MFLSDATNWLLCLNKLVHFIFPLYFHTSHIFRVFQSESVSLSVCVCELSNHFAVHRERKNTETPVLCCTSFLSWLFHRIFGMSLPYLCVLRALKLILMAGASEFLFLTTTKCNNEKALGETHLTQSWKNDGKRWRASERMKETNRSESRKEEKDERIGDDGVGTTIPTFPLYAVIMCWSGEIALSLFSLHLFASHFEVQLHFIYFFCFFPTRSLALFLSSFVIVCPSERTRRETLCKLSRNARKTKYTRIIFRVSRNRYLCWLHSKHVHRVYTYLPLIWLKPESL